VSALDGTVSAVLGALDDSLRHAQYRGDPCAVRGHCYVACEAIYHLGGKAAGFRPCRVMHEGESHWFLRSDAGEVLDPTGEQYATPVPYEAGRRAAFLTVEPSKRARIVMSRAAPAGSAVPMADTPGAQSHPALLVAPCSYSAALHAVERWHYSRTMPAPRRVLFGCWEHGRFIGAIIFSRGGSPNLPKPYGLKHTQICELTRIAFRQHEQPVTAFVAEAIRQVRRSAPGLRLIVSFADPAHAHHGGIYQAGNWIYLGTTAGDTHFIVNGRDRHSRSMAGTQFGAGRKTRQSVRYLVEHVDPDASAVKMPGKHRYAFPLDRGMRRMLLKRAEPYPAPHVEPVAPTPKRLAAEESKATRAGPAGEGRVRSPEAAQDAS